MIKGSIYQDIATLDVYALNNRTIKYVKWKLTEIKREIYKYTITGKDFNTPILIIDRVTRPSVNRIYFYRKLQTTVDYTYFSRIHRIYTKIEHILSHERNLNELKRTEIIEYILWS